MKVKEELSLAKVIMILLMIVTLAGCSKYIEKNDLLPSKAENNNTTQSHAEEYITKAQAEQSIVLPNGKIWDGTTWNGLNIQLLVIGLSSDAPITSIIGNHAEIISQEKVTINNEPALLVLVERSQPAAEEAKTGENIKTYEYWLIQSQLKPYPGREDMKLAYVLTATFTTSPDIAHSNILELAKGWKTSN